MLKEISIEIIRKCPNKCIYCSSLSDDKCSEILEYEQFVSVVKDAADLGVKTICLSGGEPFLHPRIVDMVTYVNSLGLQLYIYTSGIILDTQNKKSPLDHDVFKIISGCITKLIFNIEAAVPDTYNHIMGTTGCFEIMKQSILATNKFSIITEAHFVPMKLNIGEIKETILLCKELGVSKISFLRLVLHGRALENEQQIALSSEEFLQVKKLLETLQKNTDIDVRIGVPFSSDLSQHKCEAGTGKLNIKYDGKVFPCEVFKNDRVAHHLKGLQPESIFERPLHDIYHNSEYLQIVRKLSQDFSCNEHCETCIGQYMINKS